MQSIEEILREKQDVGRWIISYAQYISLKNALAEEKEEVQLMQISSRRCMERLE